MDGGIVFFLLLLAVVGGGFAGSIIRQRMDEARTGSAEQLALQIVTDAKKEAATLRKEAELQAKDTVFEAKSAWENEARELRRELQAQEK
ncbi:MAG: Rnase Y domain-containing protein, partial [Desulfuromonas sp.]|nr:Rnase Y domain-containing protein [Desulfuromonas sp.]